MKTMAYKYLRFLMVAALLLNLTSCETTVVFEDDDNIGGAYYAKSEALCYYVWQDVYEDQDGNECFQELTFFLNRTGEDYLRVVYPNGDYEEFVDKFVWNWEDREQYSLRMQYAPNDVSYYDDVRVRDNVLSGYFGDMKVNYIGLPKMRK